MATSLHLLLCTHLHLQNLAILGLKRIVTGDRIGELNVTVPHSQSWTRDKTSRTPQDARKALRLFRLLSRTIILPAQLLRCG